MRAYILVFSLLTPSAALAVSADALTSLHPEEAYPNDEPRLTSPGGDYDNLVRQVQERLIALGFDAGPVNGDFGLKTQTALGQFQLSRDLPASGALDQRTLAELGVD